MEMEYTERLFEEYKILMEERHQLMSRYSQALALYLAFMGFAYKGYLALTSNAGHISLFLFLTVINFLAYYGARNFRFMAMQAEKRSHIIAKVLKAYEPYSLEWGYYFGISIFLLNEVALLCMLGYYLLH